jgi:F420-0:gamma-glutamyl ligase
MADQLNEIERGQLCQSTIESLYQATGGLKHFPGLLKKIIETKAWERRVCKGRVVELDGLRELITEKPVRGWGEDPKKVEAVIKDDPEALSVFREAMVQKSGERNDLGNIVPEVDTGITGNSRAYSIARVQRECDSETVAAVMSGDMSPNAALVKAGIRENRQVYIPRDPVKAAQKLREQFGEEFFAELSGQ